MKKKLFVLLLVLILFNSCFRRQLPYNCNYYRFSYKKYCITNEYIKSGHKIKSFHLSRINVKEFNHLGVPYIYYVLEDVKGATGNNLESPRVVYFNKKNKHFTWFFGNEFSDTLPFNILPNHWYALGYLTTTKDHSNNVFFIKTDSNNICTFYITEAKTKAIYIKD